VSDLETAAGNVADELRFVVAVEWVAENKIIGHDSLERRAVPANQGLNPLIVHLSQVLFDFQRHLTRSIQQVPSLISSFRNESFLRHIGLKSQLASIHRILLMDYVVKTDTIWDANHVYAI